MKIKYRDYLEQLQNLTGIKYSHSDLSKILILAGKKVTANALSNRLSKDGYIDSDEQDIINAKLAGVQSDDCVEIDYIHINPSCGHGTAVLEEPEVTPIKLGTQMIQTVLKISNPKNLKIFRASGDSMESIIEDGDMLLIDTGRLNYNNGGIFLITINNDWFVKRLRKRLTGELDVISDNEKYPIETFKPNDDIEIVVKGRVIKNLSRGL